MMILKILLVPSLVVILLSMVMVIGSMGLATETAGKGKAQSRAAIEPTLSSGSISCPLPTDLVRMDDLENSDRQTDNVFLSDRKQLNSELSSNYIINI